LALRSDIERSAKERIAVETEARIADADRSKATIKLTLFATLACLTLLVVAAFGWNSASSWTAYRTAVEQKAFNRDVDRFIAGLYEILLERLATNVALQAAEPADASVLAVIAAHRAAIADKFDTGLAALEHWEFSNKQTLPNDLKAALNKADDYRRQADAAIKLPRDRRDAALRNDYIPVITDAVIAALKVWYVVLHSAVRNDAQLARLAIIKGIGWQMREYSGYERANVAAAIAAGTAIPADRVIANIEERAGRPALATVATNRPKHRHPSRDQGGNGERAGTLFQKLYSAFR